MGLLAMAKSIQQRVRAALEKSERAAQGKVDRANDAHFRRLEKRDLAREKRIDQLLNGEIAPRTDEDFQILNREEFGE